MSHDQLKQEINKVLEHFSDRHLHEILDLLKELDKRVSTQPENLIERILSEDAQLLKRLAQ